VKRYVNEKRVFFIRHEDLAINLEKIMKNISNLLGIQFQPSMLDNTFDGKTWWSHPIYGAPRVKGTYKGVLSKDWQKTTPKNEVFVIEGIYFDYHKKYGYKPLYYKTDTFSNKIILLLLIPFPHTIIKNLWTFYLNPINHFQFIKAAYFECTGKFERKDYTWKGTFRFKWTYARHKLYRKKFYNQSLDFVKQKIDSAPNNYFHKTNFLIISLCYITIKYMQFLIALLFLPYEYLKSLKIYYHSFFQRINGKHRLLAELLN
jgi:hypothetical protein